MITVENYASTVTPQMLNTNGLKKGHEFFKKFSKLYGKSETINQAIDKYLKLLNKAASPQKPPTPAPKAKTKVTHIGGNKYKVGRGTINLDDFKFEEEHPIMITDKGSTQFKDAVADLYDKSRKAKKGSGWAMIQTKSAPKAKAPKKTAKTTKTTTSRKYKPSKRYDEGDKVRRFEDDAKIFRWVVTNANKPLPVKTFMNKLAEIKKNVAERVITKQNPNYKLIEKVHNFLIKIADKVDSTTQKVVITVEGEAKEQLLPFKNQVVFRSVALFKRYINLQGKKPTKAQVSKLIGDIDSAYDKGYIVKGNPYFEELKQAKADLQKHQDGDILTPSATLAGLNSYRDEYFGCVCQA